MVHTGIYWNDSLTWDGDGTPSWMPERCNLCSGEGHMSELRIAIAKAGNEFALGETS